MEGLTLTWSSGATIISVFVAGLGAMWWLWVRLSNLKRELLQAIAKSRREGDAKVDKVYGALEKLTERQRDHETHVEREFIRRHEVQHSFERLDESITRMETAIDQRLIKIEERLRGMPAAAQRVEGA